MNDKDERLSPAEQAVKLQSEADADFSLMSEFDLDPLEKRYLGPLLKYMGAERLKNVKEVVINKPQEVGYELTDGTWEYVPAPELTINQLNDAARMIANRFGQIYSPSHPVMSCKMPQGHRVQVVAGHHCGSGFSLTVRIQREKNFTVRDYGIPEDQVIQLTEAIANKKTILISGGTASGKTSFMNAALGYIGEDERLITLEDVPELKVEHKNWVPLIFYSDAGEYEKGSIAELLNACLRMRPDRIILGELRKENAFGFATAINTGHEGSMSTIHANSPKMALDAVINRIMMNGDMADTGMQVLRRQLEADIYGVVQLNRVGAKVEGYFEVLEKK